MYVSTKDKCVNTKVCYDVCICLCVRTCELCACIEIGGDGQHSVSEMSMWCVLILNGVYKASV